MTSSAHPEPPPRRGALHIYLGAAPGVGKTCAMLAEAHRQSAQGVDVVVGVAQTYGRAETSALLEELETVPPRRVTYRGATFDELDVDAVLGRRPRIALVDELAHTNLPGSRHEKRWQDVDELLEAGIDVYSTVNVQHLESLNDVVEHITGIAQRETVPDDVVRDADQVEMVDVTPGELRHRLAQGKVYAADRVDAALSNYFRPENLTALRELALLWLADQVDMALDKYRVDESVTDIWETRERVVVAVTGGPESVKLVRRAARIAARSSARLMVVHVVSGDGTAGASTATMAEIRRLASASRASVHSVVGNDVAEALLEFARSVDATELVIGSSRRSRLFRILDEGVGEEVIRGAGQIDVHIVTHAGAAGGPRLSVAETRWLVVSSGVAVLILTAASTLLATRSGLRAETTGAIALFAGAVFLMSLAVVALVDVAVLRTRQARRASQEAELLALFAGSVLRGSDLPALLERVRETFGQNGVSVLRRGAGPVCSVGAHPPGTTAAASTVCEVGDGEYALALSGRGVRAHDRRVLTAVANQAVALYRQQNLVDAAGEARALATTADLRRALLAGISHDLRTPLAAIKVALSSLRSREPGEFTARDVDELLATSEESTDRLIERVDDLIDSSRLAAGEVRPTMHRVAVEESVHGALLSIARAADGRDRIGPDRVNVDVDAVSVRADPGLLGRVLENLLANALRHSGGRPVRVGAARVGELGVITVADAGPGIPPGSESRIFDPFQRLEDGRHAAGAGLGLGLSVARGFVEAMGGTATATATPGGGLTVLVTLDAASGAADGASSIR
ncbi:two-component system sensor histidine kinase KdpD [Rhodococcus sp. AG1013]|uniref:sensor histidine kinase n=1 Tax=Rhodococcus sp. AG1013 TaxID=2183996 RepID=UPI000E0AE7B3|nr:ATP-binding protein [Rhodococcus sp. AG1013]RDI23209.1 two-component system sensor histidine kinase KdpD [Rhodococcus sp. AG1013]